MNQLVIAMVVLVLFGLALLGLRHVNHHHR
jgi:hypothetical protein